MTGADRADGAESSAAHGSSPGEPEAGRPAADEPAPTRPATGTGAEAAELISQLRELAGPDPHTVRTVVDEVLAALDRVSGGTLRDQVPAEDDRLTDVAEYGDELRRDRSSAEHPPDTGATSPPGRRVGPRPRPAGTHESRPATPDGYPVEPRPVRPQPPEPHPARPEPTDPHPVPPRPTAPHPGQPDPGTPHPTGPGPGTPHPGAPNPAEPSPAEPPTTPGPVRRGDLDRPERDGEDRG